MIVHVDLEKRSGAGLLLHFEIEDTGIGVQPEALTRLFSPFEQVDTSMTRKFGGTGLGLAITRRLAMLMGGEAGGTSAPGKGSRFWFSAMVEPAKASSVSARLKSKSAAKPGETFGDARVLVVEDVELNREILLDMLREDGLKADTAENGQEAVTKAASNPYDIIFMDMQMPIMDGLTATMTIRRMAAHRETPIIAVTANVFEKSRDECLAAGMNDFLCKPLDPDDLHAALHQWLSKEPAPVAVESHPKARGEKVEGGDLASLRRCLGEIADIDLDCGLRRIKQPERYVRYLRQYGDKYEGSFSHLRDLLANGRTADAASFAHSLKGASAQLGVVGVAKQAELLQAAIKNEAEEGSIEALLTQSEERCAVVWASIQKLEVSTPAH